MKTITATVKNFSSARAKRIAVEGSWVIAGQIATIFGTLALVRVVTQYLTPAQYGQLALVLTLNILINQLITGGLATGIGRFYPIAFEEKQLRSYIKGAWKLFSYAVIVTICLLTLIITALLFTGKQQFIFQVMAVGIFTIVAAISAILSNILNIARKRLLVAVHSATEAWLKIAIVIMLLFLFRPSVIAVITGYTFASLIIAVSQAYFLRKEFSIQSSADEQKDNSRKWMQQIWKFSLPFSIWGLFTWGQQASDRWALEHFSGTADVGQYVVVFQLGYVPIGIVTGLIVSFLSPIFYQRYGTGKDKILTASVHRLTWMITVFSLITTALAFAISYLFHEWLFDFLVAPAFRTASHFLPWIVLAGGLFAAGQMLSLKLMSQLKSSEMISLKIITAIIGVILNIYGAWKFGTSGVVAALVLFSLIYFLWTIIIVERHRNETLINEHAQ